MIALETWGEWRFFRCADQRPIVTKLPVSVIPSWGWNQMLLVDREGDWWIGTRGGRPAVHAASDRLEPARAAQDLSQRYAKA